MAIVVFDADEFRNAHPGLTEDLISDEELQMHFETAELFVDNTERSPYRFDPEPKDGSKPKLMRKNLLWLVTCHLATMALWPDGQAGRLASASEGSVSASFDLIQARSENGSYWNQTRCGATYWALTKAYRLGGRLYLGRPKHHPWN